MVQVTCMKWPFSEIHTTVLLNCKLIFKQDLSTVWWSQGPNFQQILTQNPQKKMFSVHENHVHKTWTVACCQVCLLTPNKPFLNVSIVRYSWCLQGNKMLFISTSSTIITKDYNTWTVNNGIIFMLLDVLTAVLQYELSW